MVNCRVLDVEDGRPTNAICSELHGTWTEFTALPPLELVGGSDHQVASTVVSDFSSPIMIHEAMIQNLQLLGLCLPRLWSLTTYQTFKLVLHFSAR